MNLFVSMGKDKKDEAVLERVTASHYKNSQKYFTILKA